MKDNNYTFGFDIGITSVGTCILDQKNNKLVELAVRKFDQAKEAKERRLNRSQRRTLTRKKWRKEQLLTAFDDFNIIKKEDIDSNRDEYLKFYGKGKDFSVPDFPTVYHLRKYALHNKVTKREILLCIYNILHARGHFLFDTIDFSKDGMSIELFKERFYDFSEKYVVYLNDKKEFEEKVLEPLYFGDVKINVLKNTLKENRFAEDEESEDNLKNICIMLAGGKSSINKLDGNPDEKTQNIEQLKGNPEPNEVQAGLIELSDIIRISRIMKDGCNYICEIAVKEIDEFNKLKKENADEEKFKEWKKVSGQHKHLRSWRNLNNNYPNGLYVKEVKAILEKQAVYYEEITPEFIEVCISIVSAKIPYYIGPLGENTTNGWATKTGNFKYSYDYTIKHFGNSVLNEYDAIRKWKENMVSHCTYLPEEIALPKGSLLGEVFSILNEINNYYCEDGQNNTYYLTRQDKIKILDELFLKKDTVTFNDVKGLLHLNKFSSRKGTTSKFNNKITVYKTIVRLLPELRLNSIVDIFTDKDKLDKLENIILDINLFDEGKLKEDHFLNNYHFDHDVAVRLARINVKGFYSISRKFIYEISVGPEGQTIMELLLDDNGKEINNLQTILSYACDENGEIIDFISNKYEKILKENENKLSIDLIIDKGKPVMPISRPVVRALNETLKVYQECINIYGIPERVVIETAKGKDSIKDFSEQNGSTMIHYEKMSKLTEYLDKQLKEYDRNHEILKGNIEEWNDIEAYYNKNKLKIELYIRQDGIDLLTGKRIDINNLDQYEIDHILPRGFGLDSQDDKMLISRLANSKKANRLPIEFLQSEDSRSFTNMTVGEYEKIVNKLGEMKMISSLKQKYLLMADGKEAEGFINQNLVDTRYIISEFISILKAFNKVNGYHTHIACLNSAYTDMYRKVLNIRKDRDFGDQHHAYDAAALCIADKCLNQYYPNYDLRKNAIHNAHKEGEYNSYSEFVEDLEDENMDADGKLKNFIKQIFKKAFGQDVYKLGKEADILCDIKKTVPLISWKVEKNYDGKLFDVTLASPKKTKEDAVFTILGENNEKRCFETVNCVAVDFYKLNHKHYAIHIPLAIVDNNGNIDKQQYLKLVKEHYKANELLDENDEIKTYAFRFRAFKNDIIYDTKTNIPHLFNLGSITNKKLEICPMNIFSYDEIYGYSREMSGMLNKKFDLKTKNNSNGTEFKDISKEAMINYLCENAGLLKNVKKHKPNLIKLTENIRNLYDFTNTLSYCSYLANDIFAGPNFTGQIKPVVNNDNIKNDENVEYVKIKYNTLGIRFKNNENEKLITEGPREYQNGGFKKIKKEEFFWNLSKEMIE